MIDLRRYAFGATVVVAMLAGCGGTQPPVASPGAFNVPKTPRAPKQSQTFSYTGSEQTFTVPEGVTRVTIKASGASGQEEYSYGAGAPGGLIVATVRVTPGESLAVFVGSEYLQYSTGYNRRGFGGYNGGGNAGEGSSSYSGDGGGGASDVRQGGDGLQNRIVVAGGGGGGGTGFSGGSGGGKKGRSGSPPTQQGLNASGGTGGARHNGGTGGKGGVGYYDSCAGGDGADGSLGNGARGGRGVDAGGGGGGGYYGGGGGGGGGFCYEYSGWYGGFGGGGGGGSSFAEPEATHVMDKSGAAAPGNGQVIISWR
ncbi:MAG: glycine-rich protein [Candidatus Cybelea sp.]